MKLLLCLCLIFCFKTVFSEITCYVCEPTNVNNPELNRCLAHNRLNLVLCCRHYQLNCGKYISYTDPIPDHLFNQYYPDFVHEFQNSYVRNPDNVDTHRFPVPRQPNYGNIERSFSTGRFEPKPYEHPELDLDAYSDFLKRAYGRQSSYNNRNLPSNGLNLHENNPQPYYPRGSNFPRQDTDWSYPRPPNYEGFGQPSFANPFQPNPNFPKGFNDDDNSEEESRVDVNPPTGNNQPENHPSSSKEDIPKTTENPTSNLPKQNDFNSVRIVRSLQSKEKPIADIRKHTNFKLLPTDDECGKQENTDRIFAGEDTKLGEFPWMALLQYSFNGRNIGFQCGGALINNKYILTAAHCVLGKRLRPQQKLFSVRLGEHDLSKEIDCDEHLDCSDPPLNLQIEEIILHDAYNTTDTNIYNDIALIRLKENIAFTDFVAPICLPLNGEQTDPGKYMTIAGWGSINNEATTDIKQKAKVICRDQKECKEIWKDSLNVENQLCAGGISGSNTCSGDSGNPILSTSPKHQWYIEGITSFGGSNCAESSIPNVYTRVSSYLTWILDNIGA